MKLPLGNENIRKKPPKWKEKERMSFTESRSRLEEGRIQDIWRESKADGAVFRFTGLKAKTT